MSLLSLAGISRDKSSRFDRTAPALALCAGTKGATVVVFLAMIALSVTHTLTYAEAPDSDGTTRRVVILNATDLYLPAFLALDSAQRRAITAGSSAPVEFYAEALDMHRFPWNLLDQDKVAPRSPIRSLRCGRSPRKRWCSI